VNPPQASRQSFWSFPMPYVQVWLFATSLGAFIVVLASDKKPSLFNFVGQVLLGLLAVALFLYALAYLRRPWRYRIDETKLVADRFWCHPTTAIRWTDIERVTKVTQREWLRNWPEIQVQGRDGAVIRIASNVPKYRELVDAIRHRAMNCVEFDVHAPWKSSGPSAR
jgi:hypothetical protein